MPTSPAVAYGMIVVTGPNASISCGSERFASVQSSTTGVMNAPRSGSASTGSIAIGSPCTRTDARGTGPTGSRAHGVAYLIALPQAHQRSHGDGLVARIADHHSVEASAQTRDDIVDSRLGDERAADAGASLTRLGGDLPTYLLDEEVEFLRPCHGIWPEDRAVEGVGLGVEPRGPDGDRLVSPQRCGRVRASREGNEVLATEVIEQVADTAAPQLHGALRERSRRDDVAHHGGGEVCRRAGRFDDRRYSGEHRGRELLEHAPYREIECVDLQGDAGERRVHVPPDKGSFLADGLDVAVDEHVAVGQLAPGTAAVREERAAAAVDIACGVAAGRAGRGGQRIVRGLVGVEVGGECLQCRGTSLKGHALEGRSAGSARVLDHRLRIEARAG